MIKSRNTKASKCAPLGQWEFLVQCLRKELQEDGALLKLVDDQQYSIITRNSKKILELNESIDLQTQTRTNLRIERESVVSQCIQKLGMDKEPTIKDLLPELPGHVQHLIKALIDEISSTVNKTQCKASQNQMLIERLSEVAEENWPSNLVQF